MADASLAMAQAHMAQQVRQAATVQAALSRLWDETVDPADLAKTFLVFREKAVTLIGAGRILSERRADDYYRKLLAFKGLDTTGMPAVTADPRPAAVIKSSLSAASSQALSRAEYLHRQGLPVAEALAVAKSAMLGSAKRQVLNAGRNRLTRLARAHKRIRGWARVSDGNPCAFCAMLVSRGPVYSEDTVSFRAHDRCGCSVRLVTYDEPDGGWSPEARFYREAWDADKRATMRAWYESRGMPVPEKFLPQAGEHSFAEIMRRRKTDAQRARRRADRLKAHVLAA
ncbi:MULTISPECIES: hypothetical protein [Bacteria]|uniref:VG15 protein n=1 Tax=Bacteria TaxID=2 RepID=UPI003C7B2810